MPKSDMTRLVLQFDKSPLNDDAPQNIVAMVVTLAVSQREISLLKDDAHGPIPASG